MPLAVLAAQFFDFDLGSALDHVWEDGLHLVLGADHFGCLRVVAAQVDGVKLALGRTHTAANAAIVSTTLTPQPRQWDASILTCSSVNVQRGSWNVLRACAPGSAAGT